MKKLTNNSNTHSTSALIIFFAVSLLFVLWSNTAVAANNQTLHKTIDIDGVEIYYREAGQADAPTIL